MSAGRITAIHGLAGALVTALAQWEHGGFAVAMHRFDSSIVAHRILHHPFDEA